MTFLAAMVVMAALDAFRGPSAEDDRQKRERNLLYNLRREKEREARDVGRLTDRRAFEQYWAYDQGISFR